MFIGEYNPTLDAKGRVNFPAKLREDLGENFIICKWLDGCLAAFPLPTWERLMDRLTQSSMAETADLQRFLSAGAQIMEPDKQGRILIPTTLREYAQLEKDIIVAGVTNRAEIWNKERWKEVNNRLTPKAMAGLMASIGF